MSFKRVFSQRLYVTILSLMAATFILFAGNAIFVKIREMRNQHRIVQTIDYLAAHEKAEPIPALQTLLELKSLTEKQKAVIYQKLADELYLKNRLSEYLSIIGYAIFFNSHSGNVEQAIYQYALLAQYYLEIGADQAGYDMILAARRLKNFYKIEDPMIRAQALHAYGRYLLSESDFEDALKAAAQMEEDAKVFEDINPQIANDYTRRALAFKSYILLQSGKTEEAYTLACETFSTYTKPGEVWTHFNVYDFLLPIHYVQTQWAIRNRQYEKAIAYNTEYGKATSMFNFIRRKSVLLKELLFAMPDTMAKERDMLFKELAATTDALSETILTNYTSLSGSQLFAVLENLRYTNEKDTMRKHTIRLAFILLLSLFAFLLVLFAVYSETQIDGLTKLRNRRALNARIGKLAASGKRYSAIMIDIDDFKKLNDGFGHDFGDEVLKSVAQLLLTNESRYVKCYRYGGEEMVMLLEHFDLEHAVKLSESVRTEISLLKWRKEVHVTASFGLGFEMPDSLKEADENMYIAKQKGKNFTAYRKDGKQYLAERRLDIRNPMPDRS